MLYAALGEVLNVSATGSQRVGLFPFANDGQKSTLPFTSRCVCAAMNGHVLTGDHWPTTAGPVELTVIMAWAEAVMPAEFVATKLYEVVAAGEVDWDPLTGTDAPFKVALTALVDVHVRVELPPDAMEVGFALIAAVGAEPDTVRVTCPQSVAPVEL
jgi:hypothetical protein